MTEAYKIARRMALTGMAISGVLAALKIWIGQAAHSAATVADGFESAADVLASGLLIAGLTVAARPPDQDHPYGHGRYEILTGLAIGLILCVTGVNISYRSYLHIGAAGAHAPEAFAVWPLLLSLLAKGGQSYYKLRLARRIRSSALAAEGKHDLVDMVSGLVAVAALGLSLFDPVRFASADPIGGMAVGMIVLFLGCQVIRETSEQLVDTMPDGAHLNDLRRVAVSVRGVCDVEKVVARKTGLRWHVDLHMQVDPAMTVHDSHILTGLVKSALRTQLDWVENVLIHVEPYETKPAETLPE